MNTDLKFRGFNATKKEWVYGDYCSYFNTNNTCIMPKGYYATRDMGEEDEKGMPIIEDELAIGGWIHVDPKSIGQFTGLMDIIGEDLYQGDIVKCGYGIGQIVFKAGCFMVQFTDADVHMEFVFSRKGTYGRQGPDRWTKIGTVYENPELLK